MVLAAELTRGIYSRGAQDFKFMIVATGERSQLPNVGASERLLEDGDVCRVEIFSVIDGYHAGVCRSAYVTAPPDHAERIWSILSDATERLLEIIKPGASTRDIYDAYLAMIAPLDMPPIDFVGHGIGLQIHEHPLISPHESIPYEAGMMTTVETRVRWPGKVGYHMEDLIEVTESAPILRSDYFDNEDIMVV